MASSSTPTDLLPQLQELPPSRGGLLTGERLVVALSGGADSVALLDLLLRLQEERELVLVAAHLDHGLREASKLDAAFCRELCAARGIELVEETADLFATAAEEGVGLEAASRRLRYAFLDRVREERGMDRVCTAHHSSIQIGDTTDTSQATCRPTPTSPAYQTSASTSLGSGCPSPAIATSAVTCVHAIIPLSLRRVNGVIKKRVSSGLRRKSRNTKR